MEPLLHHELLLQCHVEVDHSRPVKEVDAGFQSDAAGRWREEARRIEAVERIARTRIGISARDHADAGGLRVSARGVLRVCGLNAVTRMETADRGGPALDRR